jgi:transposase-like protein
MNRVIDEQLEQLRLRRKSELHTALIRVLIIDGVHLTLWRSKKRASGKTVLFLAVALYAYGSFAVLDWEAAEGESYERYYRLLDRLYHRGLERVELVVGDGVWGLWAAVEEVCPFSKQHSLCLFHLFQAVKRALRDKRLLNQKRLGW